MSNNRVNHLSFFKDSPGTLKIQYPCLFYIEKNDEIKKRKFYILGTFHHLPVSLFTQEVMKILTSQSNIWHEHLSMIEAIQSEFNSFKINERHENSLLNWLDKINPNIKPKLIDLFQELNPSTYANIHPKFYFVKILLNIYLYSKDGKMDQELEQFYKNADKPIFCFETYGDEDVLAELADLIKIGLNTINRFFKEDGIVDFPNFLDRFDFNNPDHWASLFNFFLQDIRYQEYFITYQNSTDSNKQDFNYINNKPIVNSKPSGEACNSRSKKWYEKHFSEINDALVICGRNHVLKGENGLLKRLADDNYEIYQIDNKGNKTIFNLQAEEKTEKKQGISYSNSI